MEKKLIAYITAGYPSPSWSVELLHRLAEVGVDGVELGIPFSDPVADGPVIQEVNKRALENGFRLRDLFAVAEKSRGLPLKRYFMGYFNTFYHRGYKKFADEARELGINGFIIPDLPREEAEEYLDLFPLIPFVAPTDSPDRIAKVVEGGKEFVYLVAYAGITGADKEEELSEVIEAVRRATSLPVYLGFGVKLENIDRKGRGVDGVVVGTELVREFLEGEGEWDKVMDRIVEKARLMKEKLRESGE
jgi:tryptophan synthase alpha chain